MIVNIALGVLFFLSIIFTPWWFAVVLGIVVASRGEYLVILPIGGVLLDVLFGTPILTLGGFSFLYTALFSIIALAGFLLKDMVV